MNPTWNGVERRAPDPHVAVNHGRRHGDATRHRPPPHSVSATATTSLSTTATATLRNTFDFGDYTDI